MASGAGIGGLLGTAASFIPGVNVAAPLLGGLGSLLGGLFGGADTIDTSPYTQQANKFNSLGDRFTNPNDSFYTDATKLQRQSLIDLLMANIRRQENALARKGIDSTALNSQYAQNASINATEKANQFANQNYKQGLGFAQNLYGLSNQALGQMRGGEQFNATQQGNFNNGFMDIGSSLLGQYLGNSNNSANNSTNNNAISGYNSPLGGEQNINNNFQQNIPSTFQNLFGNGGI